MGGCFSKSAVVDLEIDVVPAGDVQEVVEGFRSGLLTTPEGGTWTPPRDIQSRCKEAGALARRIPDNPAFQVHRRMFGGSVVGLIQTEISGGVCNIQYLVTHQHSSYKGGGTKLVGFFQSQYRQVIAVNVNPDAAGFWEKVGFVPRAGSTDWVWPAS